jgi:Flp pilus assembly protein TadB
VSKERARRRAQRLAVADRDKSRRARRVARRDRRRSLVRRLTPRRRRTGRLLMRRTRGQRAGIVVLPLVAVAAVWFLVPDPALRLLLIALLIFVLPAVVVVVLDRRS